MSQPQTQSQALAPGKKRRRKAPRLTLPAKKRQKRINDRDGDVDLLERGSPTAEEFTQWPRFRSFVVKDQLEDGEPVTFEMGGYGLIVHGTGKNRPEYLHEYWVGRIKDIRSRARDPTEVWAKVEWLWSARDIAQVTKQVDIKPFGVMERLSSDECDLVHSSCFQDVAHVVHFDELNPEPPLITDETFYIRYAFDFAKKCIKPKVRSTCLCLCGKPYNPDDASSMYFCPRKKCNKAYHAACLQRRGYVQKPLPTPLPPPSLPPLPLPQSTDRDLGRNQENNHNAHLQTPPRTPTNSRECDHSSEDIPKQSKRNAKTSSEIEIPRFLQFERTLPNTTLCDSKKAIPPDILLSLSSSTTIPSSPISPVNASVSQTPPVPTSTSTSNRYNKGGKDRLTFTRYKLIPPVLLALARSPMVRGDTDETGLDEETGCVAGNVAFVARARRIVERVVRGGEPLGEEGEWVKELGVPLKGGGVDGDCGAGDKVMVKGTGKEKLEEEVTRWVVEDKGYLCPGCGGVI